MRLKWALGLKLMKAGPRSTIFFFQSYIVKCAFCWPKYITIFLIICNVQPTYKQIGNIKVLGLVFCICANSQNFQWKVVRETGHRSNLHYLQDRSRSNNSNSLIVKPNNLSMTKVKHCALWSSHRTRKWFNWIFST